MKALLKNRGGGGGGGGRRLLPVRTSGFEDSPRPKLTQAPRGQASAKNSQV